MGNSAYHKGRYPRLKPEILKKKKAFYINNKEKIQRQQALYRATDAAKRKKWESTIKKKYNLLPEDWARMYHAQNGSCAICKNFFEEEPVIDHCHTTNKVRGLLCWSCNLFIGHAKESIEALKGAIAYLTLAA